MKASKYPQPTPPTSVIGANAAFNNRTKEELEIHMFKKCVFSLYSLCGFGNFILTVGLARDKKEARWKSESV